MSRLAVSLLLSVKLLKHYKDALITNLVDKELVFTTISDATFRQVVRSHLDLNFVASQNANVMLTHLT